MTIKAGKWKLVKVAGNSAVWVPPHSASNIDVTGLAFGTSAVVEPLSTPLKGDSKSGPHWWMLPGHVLLCYPTNRMVSPGSSLMLAKAYMEPNGICRTTHL